MLIIAGLLFFVPWRNVPSALGSPEFVAKAAPYIILGIFAAVFLWLFVFQWRKSTRFPEVSNKFLITIPPLILNILAIAAFWLSPTPELSVDILTAIFGTATLAGAMLSFVTLITIRNTFTDEIALAEHAAELIRKARKRLIFLALTPNLGFAAAARRGHFAVCTSLTVAIQEALPELAKRAHDRKATVIIGLLHPEEQQEFYDRKKELLKRFQGELVTEKSAASSYERFTNDVCQAIDDAHTNGGGTNFQLFYWKRKCTVPLDPNRPDEFDKDFPPLGILIGDDSAVISYNAPLVLSDQPVDFRGRLLRSHDEVESFRYLVDAYIEQYADK